MYIEDGVNNVGVQGQLLSSSSPGEHRPSLTVAGVMVNTCSEEVTVFQWLQFSISGNNQMETAPLPFCLSLNSPSSAEALPSF